MISEWVEMRVRWSQCEWIWDRDDLRMTEDESGLRWGWMNSEWLEIRVRRSQSKLRWGWDELSVSEDESELRCEWDDLSVSWDGLRWGWDNLSVSGSESELRSEWDDLNFQFSVFEGSLAQKLRFHIFNFQFFREVSHKSFIFTSSAFSFWGKSRKKASFSWWAEMKLDKMRWDEMRSDENEKGSNLEKMAPEWQVKRLLLRSTQGLPAPYRHILCFTL